MTKTVTSAGLPGRDGEGWMKVLVVDDSAAVRARLVRLLAEQRCVGPIAEIGDPNVALQTLPWFHPDVVILDLAMPGRSGLDLLREIRRAGDGPLVVVLTNHVDAHYRNTCLNLGADHFLDKSREFHRVLEVLIERCEQIPPPNRA
jgi:DNA-binding NarL/FixJ family response regulator